MMQGCWLGYPASACSKQELRARSRWPACLQAQSMVGTPYYMAPECIRGHPYDWSSDVWSLGCLLYEMAAMRSPFWRVSSRFTH